MKIHTLHIEKLRNHISTDISFSPAVNIIYGQNGAGKTTILEAIHICSFTKSFLPSNESALVNSGSQSFLISARCITDLDVPYNVAVTYLQGKRKKISSTAGDNLTAKNIIGDLPCVVLSPDHKIITFGSPADRRMFVDKILSQSYKIYLEDLLELRKCLKQRNTLLSDFAYQSGVDDELFGVWTDHLINISARIVSRRIKFADEFPSYFQNVYREVSQGKENVSLSYKPFGITEDVNLNSSINDISEALARYSKGIRKAEIRRGLTLFGPQKDEFEIKVNGSYSRDYASQGQHKSLLISLKFAEFNYLKEMKNETPIILLDDIFAELDKSRINEVTKILQNINAQTFITTTDLNGFEKVFESNNLNNRLYVNNGIVSA